MSDASHMSGAALSIISEPRSTTAKGGRQTWEN